MRLKWIPPGPEAGTWAKEPIPACVLQHHTQYHSHYRGTEARPPRPALFPTTVSRKPAALVQSAGMQVPHDSGD